MRWASLLFVPSDQPRKIARAHESGAHALVLDWEDSVAEASKVDARRLALEFIRASEFAGSTFIRVHSVRSRHFTEDCAALQSARPDGIVLSKCGTAEEVRQLAAVLKDTTCGILPLIESPAGVVNCSAIVTASDLVIGAAFGAEDFSAEMEITRSEGEPELLYARCAIATACRAAGVEPIDTPFLEYRDDAGLRNAAMRSSHLGFTGKLAIHPAQVPILNEVFSPTSGQLEEARRLLETFESSKTAVLGIEGRMVDEAVVKRARRLLASYSDV
jgi:citrate lyase subunit beta/citryl-CoA lyase